MPLLETIAAYKDLKENLGEYLKKFAENKKVSYILSVYRFRLKGLLEVFILNETLSINCKCKTNLEVPFNALIV